MEQKFILVEGIQIAYYIKNDDKENTIFFIHGNSSSHRTWQRQFSSSLLSQYRLIAFDLPAHGLSDAAAEVTYGYSLPGIARLMAKVVLELAEEIIYSCRGFIRY